MTSEADKELEEQLLEARNKLVDPPSSPKELLPLLDSAVVTRKPTFSVSTDESSDLDMIANDQQISNPACSVEHMPMPISEHNSSQFSVFTKDSQEEKLQEHGTEKAQNPRCKKHKKETNLPLRASKRLAGIKVDPVPELQTRRRARRVAVKQSGGGETITDELSTPEKLHEKTAEENGSNKDQECFPLLPQEMHSTVLENGDNSLDFPLGEILADKCIAFAVQILTGVTFETSQIPSESKNSEHSETSAAATKKINDKEGCNVFSSPEKFPIPQEHVGGPKIDEKNKGSSSEKTVPDISWMNDPCIEFAIKTLTGP